VKRSRTARLSARVGPGLIKAACSKTNLNKDSELVNAALRALPHQMIFDRGPQPNLDDSFNRSLPAMIPVVGLDLWCIGQNRISFSSTAGSCRVISPVVRHALHLSASGTNCQRRSPIWWLLERSFMVHRRLLSSRSPSKPSIRRTAALKTDRLWGIGDIVKVLENWPTIENLGWSQTCFRSCLGYLLVLPVDTVFANWCRAAVATPYEKNTITIIQKSDGTIYRIFTLMVDGPPNGIDVLNAHPEMYGHAVRCKRKR
jgi:hypothetical protein